MFVLLNQQYEVYMKFIYPLKGKAIVALDARESEVNSLMAAIYKSHTDL